MPGSMTNGKAVLLIEAAKSRAELHWALEQITRDIGYQHFCYIMRINIDLSRPTFINITNYPKAWLVKYMTDHFERLDPVAKAVQGRSNYVLWQDVRDQAADFFAHADEHGLSYGISMPVAGFGTELHNINLARTEQVTAEEVRDTEFFIRNMAHYTGEQLLRILETEKIEREKESGKKGEADLSPREVECLRWVADGKTSWEIATILEIAERTVIFHLQNAKRKLGAAGRHQAAVKAASLGFLTHLYDPDIVDTQFQLTGSSPF